MIDVLAWIVASMTIGLIAMVWLYITSSKGLRERW